LDLVGQDIGAYRILSLLGRGGTAEVYKAFHPALKREVAVKVLLQEVSHDVDWVRRFRQEAEVLGSLDHPHILPIYDAGEHNGRPFLVMKYMVDTSTLRVQLDGHPWPLNRVVKVVLQVADALDAAHRAGVVHRDIKPSNILVTADLRCSVFDFGIAKPFRRQDTTTGADHVVGTPEFMSPEQCKGDRIDHRSDVYSLGVMTYQMLAGHVPFTAETAVGILMKHLTEPLPIPPRGVALPPTVNAVLRKGMARDPQERFDSAGDFARALNESADQRATVTLHASELRRAAIPTLKLPPWVRELRRREVRLALAGGAVGLALLGLWALWPPKVEPEPSVAMVEETAPLAEDEGEAALETVAPPPLRTESGPPAHAKDLLATLEIESNEPATVTLDGAPLGRAPGVFRSVPPGQHVIGLDDGSGRMEEKTIVVTAGSTQRVRFDLHDTARAEAGTAATNGHPVQTAPRPLEVTRAPAIREWTGFLTDGDCGETGGLQGLLHLRCAERCIREGQQPMLYSRGKLYRIEGFDRIRLEKGEPLRFRGWLELDTIHVVSN
jgi:tRNA A-37 threonylcarbamoyl transferase component Bud32